MPPKATSGQQGEPEWTLVLIPAIYSPCDKATHGSLLVTYPLLDLCEVNSLLGVVLHDSQPGGACDGIVMLKQTQSPSSRGQ